MAIQNTAYSGRSKGIAKWLEQLATAHQIEDWCGFDYCPVDFAHKNKLHRFIGTQFESCALGVSCPIKIRERKRARAKRSALS